MPRGYHQKNNLTNRLAWGYCPLMPRKKVHDPDWLYPHQTREQVENLRVYFELHLPNRIRSWKQQKDTDTHALARVDNKWGSGEPWASVPPHFRPKVQAWFEMMLRRVKHERGCVSPGKIRSLRMNAAYFGRYVLTGKRRANKSAYDRMKRNWLKYKAWETQQQRTAFVKRQGPMPRKVLDFA